MYSNLSVTVMTALLGAPIFVAATVSDTASDPDVVNDAWTAMGAFLATVIAVGHARTKDAGMRHFISVVVASAFLGSALPGALIYTFHEEFAFRLKRHGWAMCGFAVGLVGWQIVELYYMIFPPLISKWISKRTGIPEEQINRCSKTVENKEQ